MPSFAASIAIALASGIALGDRFALDPGKIHLATAVVAILGPLVLRRPRDRVGLAITLAVLAGAAAISVRLVAARIPVPGGDLTLEGRPCGRPPVGAGLLLCRAWVASGHFDSNRVDAQPFRFAVQATAGSAEARALNDVARAPRVRVRVRTRPLLGPRNPGASDRRHALWRRGIAARGYLIAPEWVVAVGGDEPGRPGPLRRSGALRDRVSERLREVGPGGALLAALALGDRTGLAPESRSDFARLGTAHLLAVSGLHVAIVAGLGYAVSRRLLVAPLVRVGVADPRGLAAAAALAAAGGYATLAGLGVPLQRALVAAIVLLAAFATGRSWPIGSVLGVAATAVLLADPAALFEPGPQLSFAAAGALMAAARAQPTPSGDGRWARLVEVLRGSVRTSAIAIAATAPILAGHGMLVSSLGLAMNAVAVPVTALLLLPSALLATGIAALPRVVGGDGLIVGLAWPAGVALDAVRAMSAALPADGYAVRVGVVGVALAAWVATGVLRMRRDVPRLLVVVALGAWLRAAPVAAVPPHPPRVVAFDVGQGDALLVEGRSAAMLVDGGRSVPGRIDMGSRVVVPALAALGVDSLDVVMASHADVDHRGGLVAVLQRMPVRQLWLPTGSRDADAFRTLRRVAAVRGVAIEEVGADDGLRRVGDLEIELLWPPRGHPLGSDNDGSIVARVSVDGDRVLLTGDVGRAVEARLVAERADPSARVLKVAHHGSDTSSAREMLEAVGARIALVSAGCAARSGLPRRRVLERLQRQGMRIFWTGRDGAVAIALGVTRTHEPIRRFGERRADCVGAPVREAPVDCVARGSACE